jgi:uncharacterized membrane protein
VTGRYRYLLPAAIATVLCWALVLSAAPPALRTVAAVPIIFFLPGYALLGALALNSALGFAERSVLQVGTSCGMTIVVAIAVGLASDQLTDAVVTSILAGLILACLAIAALRIRRTAANAIGAGGGPAANTDDRRDGDSSAPRSARRVGGALVLWAAAAALVVASLLIASQPAQSPGSDVEQLWITRQGTNAATVGVYNGTENSATYRLTIGPAQATPGADPISMDISLDAGAKWQKSVAFPATWPTGSEIVAHLYRGSEATPMRMVKLGASPSASPAASPTLTT